VSWWSLILAWLGNLFGQRSGAASQRVIDQTAALKQQVEVEHAVNQAEASAPVDRAGVSSRLRDGNF
jgi:hypothetical protein